MELAVIKVTPKVAAEMLANNIDINRSIRHGHLERLCSDMRAGLWDASNGETLKFKSPKEGEKYGSLVDGQHRLHAIIETGSTFTLPCLIGVSEDSFATLDSGSKRTFADLLGQKQIHNKNAVAAGTVVLEQFYQGNFRTKSISHRALLNRFNQHPELEHYANAVPICAKVLKPSEAVFFSYVFNSIAPKKGTTFMHLLANGGASEGQPVHELREKLLSLRIKRPTGHTYVARDFLIGSVFKAWNMQERKSKDLFTMLSIGEDIEYPVGFAKYFTDIEVGGIER